ncbi:hypothetical protein [Vibrio sp. WXL210]|uniref:hypothetical protein n=1 Tax=Vibrio sp. WXL210 TaxID=3450709 RepID=UPI003EC8C798
MSHVLVGILGVLIGAFLGHRFALGRDQRKEYNALVMPVREILLKQLRVLKAGDYEHGINESHMICLQAGMSNSKFRRLEKIYTNYSDCRSKAGDTDMYHQFTKNEEYFDRFIKETEKLLKELRPK